MLGLPPVWYKSAPYRSRAVKEPRGVLADFGVTLPADTEIRVWDSTAETRYLVVPMRPAGTEGWSEERLADARHARLDDRHRPAESAERGRLMNGIHDMGGMDGFGRVEPEPDEPVFHETWEGRVLAMNRAMGATGAWNIDMVAFAREQLPPQRLSRRYLLPAMVAAACEQMLLERGLVDADEIAAGHALRPGKALARGPFTADDVDARADPRSRSAGRRRRPRGSRWVTACARGTSTRRRTRACRATCAATSAWSSASTAATSSPTRPRPARARIRNGSTPCVFEGRELWGPDADPTVKVSIDAFEPYLDPA